MKITLDQVRHVARLARLNLPEDRMRELMQNMNDILGYMDMLNEVDTTGVEPTSHVMDIRNVFREDEVKPSLAHEKSLQNAPQENRDSFVVPRVI
jgi:aspartyl-tRNA(Asn)/glutamyl-tRNA(Gln) amidotransferase subunit C